MGVIKLVVPPGMRITNLQFEQVSDGLSIEIEPAEQARPDLPDAEFCPNCDEMKARLEAAEKHIEILNGNLARVGRFQEWLAVERDTGEGSEVRRVAAEFFGALKAVMEDRLGSAKDAVDSVAEQIIHWRLKAQN